MNNPPYADEQRNVIVGAMQDSATHRRELEDIMDALKDAPPEKKPSWFERGEKWLVKHKAALGAGAVIIEKALGVGMEHPPK
jgi:hypothetical protein